MRQLLQNATFITNGHGTQMTPIFLIPIKILRIFFTVNLELEKISQWFKDKKLSINIKKTNFTLFHKNSFKD